ncbi:hypothetical protein DM01DRAFT_1291142 [Hesseltinella vesiculosa]|uniref:Enhancer of translation termination 1 n=1 Tax=Hesseltinella vesiculosa TaxID=101127 RepID=A0A1X2GAP9_9FUNG|nr:hypothetical protein DM01DRAFT_1291142 [Hesseltinella vesiculosa]
MAIEKKRPRGLKSSTASNKNKQRKTEPAKEGELPENAQTVMISKEVDEGDEVGEVVALYEDAMSKLHSQPTEAATVLRGVIHESDRILRNWEGEQPLPPAFYYTYGSALYQLGKLSDDDDPLAFVEAAEERLQNGLDHWSDEDSVDMHKLRLSLGNVLLAKADGELAEVPETAKESLDQIKKASAANGLPTSLLLEVAVSVQSHAELYSDQGSRELFTKWASDTMDQLAKDSSVQARALHELGLGQLSWANYWMDQMDDDECESSEEKAKACTALAKAKNYLVQAQEKSQEPGSQLLCDLAEVSLMDANFMEDEDQQKAVYDKVLGLVEDAKRLGGTDYKVPEGLALFVDEMQN